MTITAYERGWLAAYRKEAKHNPFVPGTDQHADYEKAYNDEAEGQIDGPKYLGLPQQTLISTQISE